MSCDSKLAELEQLLPDDVFKQRILNYYTKNSTYLPSIIKSIKTVLEPGAFNIAKTTRAGYTTNVILATLFLNKSITVVEPFNKIAYETVMDAYRIYRDIVHEDAKIARHIWNNNSGCSRVVEKIHGNLEEDDEGCKELEELDYLLSGNCKECEKELYPQPTPDEPLYVIPPSRQDRCAIKTMLDERAFLFIWSTSSDKSKLIGYLQKSYRVDLHDAEIVFTDSTITITKAHVKFVLEMTPDKKEQDRLHVKMTCNGIVEWFTVKKDENNIKVYGFVRPDIVTITYSKLNILNQPYSVSEKNRIFKSMIRHTDIILLDEAGTFLEKLFKPMLWQDGSNGMVERLTVIKNRMVVSEDFKYLNKLVEEYLLPFVNGLNEHLKERAKSDGFTTFKEYLNKRRLPEVFVNPLLDLPSTNQKDNQEDDGNRLSDLDTKKLFIAFRHDIENAMVDAASFSSLNLKVEDVEFIDGLFNLCRAETHIFVRINKNHKDEIQIAQYDQHKTLNELQQSLKHLKYDGRILLISDATVPPTYLSRIVGLEVTDRMYGDPLNTDNKTLIVNYNTVEKFDSIRWNKNSQYRNEVLRIIESFLTFKPKPVLWCMNKEIAEDLVRRLRAHRLRAEMLNNKNMNNDAILVSYYKSIYSRGVANNRRVHITLGNAHKPRGSYAGLVLGALGIWNVVDSYDMMHNISQEAKRLFNVDLAYGVSDNQQPIFDFLSDCIQNEYTIADAWQAMSRAKDPSGKNRCAIICLGWSDDEVYQLKHQGAETYYAYTKTNNQGIRYHANPDMLLPPPHISIDINDVSKWMSGQDINETPIKVAWYTGYQIHDLFLQTGRDVLNQRLVYSQFAKTFNLNPTDWKNGFFVGIINLWRKYFLLMETTIDRTGDELVFIKDKKSVSIGNAINN